jgi:hypothetical protein
MWFVFIFEFFCGGSLICCFETLKVYLINIVYFALAMSVLGEHSVNVDAMERPY